MHTKYGAKTRWRCANYRVTNCKAVLYSTGQLITAKWEHNHDEPNSKLNDYNSMIPKQFYFKYSEKRKK